MNRRPRGAETASLLASGCLALLLASGGCDTTATHDIGGNDPMTIVAFGDSISSGESSSDGQGYRELLRDHLAAAGRTGLRVVDAGLAGALSDSGVRHIERVLLQHRPAVLILLLGTNDEFIGAPRQAVFRFAGTTSGNLRQIVAAARANTTLVVLSTLPPVCTESRAGQRANIVLMNEKILELAAELQSQDSGVFFADAWGAFLAAGPPDGCGLINLDRGNHPNDAGYAVLAKTYYETLADVRW